MLSDKKIVAFVAVIVLLVILYVSFSLPPRRETYFKLNVNDRITILRYEHDTPVVHLKNGKTNFNLFVPPSHSRYLINNDSIVKKVNSPYIYIIRDSGDVRIITTLKLHRENYELALVKRKVAEIKK